jgi:hypothetical protein
MVLSSAMSLISSVRRVKNKKRTTSLPVQDRQSWSGFVINAPVDADVTL